MKGIIIGVKLLVVITYMSLVVLMIVQPYFDPIAGYTIVRVLTIAGLFYVAYTQLSDLVDMFIQSIGL